MAAANPTATLVHGETLGDFRAKFRKLIDDETDPTKKAALEAQLAEKEASILAKRYRCVFLRVGQGLQCGGGNGVTTQRHPTP